MVTTPHSIVIIDYFTNIVEAYTISMIGAEADCVMECIYYHGISN